MTQCEKALWRRIAVLFLLGYCLLSCGMAVLQWQ